MNIDEASSFQKLFRVVSICDWSISSGSGISQISMVPIIVLGIGWKAPIVTSWLQVDFDLFEVSNSGLQISIQRSVSIPCEVKQTYYSLPSIAVHFRPAVDASTKHAKMNEIPGIWTFEPRSIEITLSKAEVAGDPEWVVSVLQQRLGPKRILFTVQVV